MKRFVQFLQASLVCGLLVVLIFSIPAVMAAAPIHLDISVLNPARFLSEHWGSANNAL
ncbi:hypothetical protein [Hyphomicrobium sp.]|uniref:hypothetical protein n=1 Tax=Hyphomicrobium sp. TaxID=82 RepID=UPI0025C5060D|nr:hypothetical protein [Hyphomicrobium sp.]